MQIQLHKIQDSVNVDYDSLADNVKDFVIHYGLTQILNDAMSGVKVGRGQTATEEQAAEGRALVDKRLSALLAGELRARRQGAVKEPVDPVAKRALAIAETRVRESADFKNWVSAHKPPVKEVNAQVRRNAEAAASKFMDLARKQLDDEAKAAAKLGIEDVNFTFETPTAEAA